MTPRCWIALLLAAALPLAVHGQPPVPFKSETRLVVLHATVRNSRGEAVTNLKQSAFAVFENGRRQPITIVRRDDIPVSLGLLIDNSGSMRSLRTRVEAAALAFVRASNPLDETFVINFADKVHVDVPFTNDLHELENGIARVDAIGGTAMRDAVDMAQSYAVERGTRDRKVLLVITDGNDNASTTALARIQQQAERGDMVIYAIGLFAEHDGSRTKRGEHELDQLTQRTGGVAYYPASIDQIDAVVLDVAHQIRNQYTIGYTSTDQTLDGSFRSIRVTASGSERYSVRTRAGYRAIASTSVH